MTDLRQSIQSLAEKFKPEVQAIREHLHKNPELSFQEYKTADFIEAELRKMGFTAIERKADTGIVLLLHGSTPGKTIALRADIDALPIVETNDVPYKSQNNGVMHACGHDVHTSSLLGAIKILHELRAHWQGTIKCIFQPGEEKAPGGASMLIKEGVLKNPEPKAILGQHVMPLIDAGKVGFRSGKYMASADEIYLTIKGKGGHGAMPENAIDPIIIASHIIVALQTIVSRNASPKMPSVLTFGKIIGGGANNVIPDEVKIDGTFRTFDEHWRSEAKQKIREMAEGMAKSMGATCQVDIVDGYPFLENDPELTQRMQKAAEAYLGKENVQNLDLWMAAEDFAYYSQHMSACFYRLGVRNEGKGINSGVHTSTFDIDDDALKTGMGLMAWLALQDIKA